MELLHWEWSSNWLHEVIECKSGSSPSVTESYQKSHNKIWLASTDRTVLKQITSPACFYFLLTSLQHQINSVPQTDFCPDWRITLNRLLLDLVLGQLVHAATFMLWSCKSVNIEKDMNSWSLCKLSLQPAYLSLWWSLFTLTNSCPHCSF